MDGSCAFIAENRVVRTVRIRIILTRAERQRDAAGDDAGSRNARPTRGAS